MFAFRPNALLRVTGLATAAILFGTVPNAGAQPSIARVDGTFAHGAVVTIRGSGFGVKTPAKPLVWADFETSLQPTTLGIVTAWSAVARMTRVTDTSADTPGAGFASGSDNSGSWALRIDADGNTIPYWNANRQKVYVYRLLKKNYTIYNTASNNIKYWRIWEATTNYPNIYFGRDAAMVENTAGLAISQVGFWAGSMDFNTTPNVWSAQEIIYQASSGVGIKDGTLTLMFDGVNRTAGLANTIMTRPASSPGNMSQHYPIHDVIANKDSWVPAWSAAYRMWVDEVYVDTTWARVMLGDAPTFAACTKLSPQIPSNWPDGSSITITVNVGLLRRSGSGYLYVIDAQGRANAEGHFVSFSSGAAPAPARPTGVVVR